MTPILNKFLNLNSGASKTLIFLQNVFILFSLSFVGTNILYGTKFFLNTHNNGCLS